MIVFTSATGCFYHYANTRSQTVPFAILQNHFDVRNWVDNNGNNIVISTDGWYDVEWLKDDKENFYAVLVGCMVHLRRYFWEVYDVH
ncbi:MAG: transposase, partial [Succinivibrionaceae bacterium]|nr:transposase [Succinivibrionaceae bacterium]